MDGFQTAPRIDRDRLAECPANRMTVAVAHSANSWAAGILCRPSPPAATATAEAGAEIAIEIEVRPVAAEIAFVAPAAEESLCL